MTWTPEQAGALDALDGILNGGGDADDVLRAAVDALHERGIARVAIRFVEDRGLVEGPSAGRGDGLRVPIEFGGARVGELELGVADEAFARTVATLLSAHVLLGWDTGGEGWDP
jgi:hypothetical protein